MGASKRRLTSPPNQPTGLALDDPFVAGLGLIQLVYGGLNYDFAAERPLQSRATLPVTRAESLLLTAQDSGAYRIALPSERTQSFTVGVLVKQLTGTTDYCPIIGMMLDQAGSPPYGDQIDTVAGRIRFAFNTNGQARSTDPNNNYISTTDFDWIFATFSDGYQAVYKNGVLIQSSTSPGYVSYTDTSVIGIGSVNGDGRVPGFEIKVALRSNHVISTAEMATIMANPGRLARNPQRGAAVRRRFAAPTYILNAIAGAFGFSPANASIVARRRLVSAVGSLAFAASAAGLKIGRRLSAAGTSFAATFAAGGLRASRRLQGAAVPFGMAASGANLIAARKLAADSGSFALSGGAVSFIYTPKPGGQGPTYTLTGGSGAFLLSANAASLLLARRLVAAAGAFSATGAPVSLLAARRLPTAAGAFSTAGTAAGLRASRRMSVGAGIFVAAAATARLIAARKLITAIGGFSVIGSNAVLTYSGAGQILPPTVPASRTVNFGGGSNRVDFAGGTNRVNFDGGMNKVIF